MLEVTLYVLPSGLKNADLKRTVDSFTYYNEDIDKEITLIKDWKKASSIRDVMSRRNGNEDDWYMIVYDNEHITTGLAYALHTHMNSDSDVLVIMRNAGGISQSPRAFRNFIKLPAESLLPDKAAVRPVVGDPIKYNRVLDGWIREHV